MFEILILIALGGVISSVSSIIGEAKRRKIAKQRLDRLIKNESKREHH